ncbi:MAG TPA: peptide ABC transporter substrate-binding protein [Acidobacteriota bacterium]|nr:peptide ABC transporter substrate-binding protein [Acidobacteriota bacterium]
MTASSGRVAACAIIGLLVWGCGQTVPDDAAGPVDGARKILRVAYNREIDVLNAFTSQMLIDIHSSIVEGLITTNENSTFIPVLAKQIPTEDNGLIVRNEDGTLDMTWELHENVRWHDGEEFTSADVCFTWAFVTSDGSETYNRDQYLGIIDCQTPDDYTVVMRWDDAYGYYAGLFEAILPEHVLGGMSTREIINYVPYNRGTETIGTGPFKFAEWRAGEYIRVVRNDDYRRGPQYPRIDEIVWSFVPDSNARLNAMRTGRYDYGQIEPTQVREVANLPGYDIHLVTSNRFMHLDLGISTEHGERLFADTDVRRAIFHAIDRQAIADGLMQGTVRVADTPINPASPYHNPEVPKYAFDPRRSAELLEQAGWHLGPDGVRSKGSERFSFTMINRAGDRERIAIAQVIQAQLKAIGIEVTFVTMESAAWTQQWRRGEWEAIVSAWFLSADPSVSNLYLCDGSNNMTGLCDPQLDIMMRRSDRAIDFAVRKPLLDTVQVLLAESARSLPIYYGVTPEVVSKRVVNYRGSGTNFGSFWNLYEWDLRR